MKTISITFEPNQVRLIENMLRNLARINPDGDSRIDAKQRATIKTAKLALAAIHGAMSNHVKEDKR